MTSPVLPDPVLLSLGRISSDFAVIEQNLKDHEAYMDAASTAWGFTAISKSWKKLALARYPARRAEIEQIAHRLDLRAQARNWAVHWVWSIEGEELLGASKNYSYQRPPVPVDRIKTTISALGEQADLVTEIRQRVLELLSLLRVDEDDLIEA